MICSRCGRDDTTGSLDKRVERGASRICSDCRAKPAYKVLTEYGVCIPHHGEFDADDNPLDEFGYLLMPGFRKCFKSDCVNPEHILNAAEIERHDISYRTGRKLSFKEFWAKLMKEGKND
jgi:hypothetical protein